MSQFLKPQIDLWEVLASEIKSVTNFFSGATDCSLNDTTVNTYNISSSLS